MRERYVTRAEAERLTRELQERIFRRCREELPARFAPLMRRGVDVEQEWGEAVERICAEEMVRMRRELRALEVEGSA